MVAPERFLFISRRLRLLAAARSWLEVALAFALGPIMIAAGAYVDSYVLLVVGGLYLGVLCNAVFSGDPS